ncbi:MAG: septal ring lytic transglycosylase RlpA family protein [Saprospiraceae bacterium]|nr:septal ring lytic transglycosylase RlpA family protein [Saprospiraceae bacterium]
MKGVLILVIISLAYAFTFLAKNEDVGYVSYYSDSFQNRRTASGEKYDKNKYTGAHRKYAFGTYVKVTRLDNKKSVVVKINDRGPHVRNRIIDISKIAAKDLGILGKTNTIKVSVEKYDPDKPKASEKKEQKDTESVKYPPGFDNIIPRAKNNEKLPSPDFNSKGGQVNSNIKKDSPYELYKIQLDQKKQVGYAIQVACLTDYDNVLKKVADLQSKLYNDILIHKENVKGQDVYKILLGPLPDQKSANNLKLSAHKKGVEGFIIDFKDL